MLEKITQMLGEEARSLLDHRCSTVRKAFQKPMKDGVELLHAIQDVYLEKSIEPA